MTKRGIELGTFCSRERCLNHSATAPHVTFKPNLNLKQFSCRKLFQMNGINSYYLSDKFNNYKKSSSKISMHILNSNDSAHALQRPTEYCGY